MKFNCYFFISIIFIFTLLSISTKIFATATTIQQKQSTPAPISQIQAAQIVITPSTKDIKKISALFKKAKYKKFHHYAFIKKFNTKAQQP